MIEPDHPRLSIVRQCELASISRSSFYRAPTMENEATLRLMRHALGYAFGKAMPRADTLGGALPIASDDQRPMQDARGPSPGAPKGNKNALRHGHYSAEAISRRRSLAALIRASKSLSSKVGLI